MERTLTFTMEDALISTTGLLILTGAGLIEPENTEDRYIPIHTVETTDNFRKATAESGLEGDVVEVIDITVEKDVLFEDNATVYVMVLKDGDFNTEPYIGSVSPAGTNVVRIMAGENYTPDLSAFEGAEAVIVDYYYKATSGVQQIEITPDKFGGNYYLEASTLFRDTNGVDMPAEFIIPNCKVQSNFTFTMASSGDPSTFTFTMDAFPDYTKFNKKTKVLAAIQVITDEGGTADDVRTATRHDYVAG